MLYSRFIQFYCMKTWNRVGLTKPPWTGFLESEKSGGLPVKPVGLPFSRICRHGFGWELDWFRRVLRTLSTEYLQNGESICNASIASCSQETEAKLLTSRHRAGTWRLQLRLFPGKPPPPVQVRTSRVTCGEPAGRPATARRQRMFRTGKPRKQGPCLLRGSLQCVRVARLPGQRLWTLHRAEIDRGSPSARGRRRISAPSPCSLLSERG
jgi:hypothetical protein